ncbi:respiratory nitrate reductase subunit gamma [Streptomyces fractus]|uniref:respiratory nitrate reductase subunit gamma n=1 Tax=Streptomyces fractus TaxID=641806 RepID=UPI003CF439E2
MNTFLWGSVPYIALAVLVSGLVWRYRYDKFGWTTRSSQSYETRILRIASPLFHFGIFAVIAGHVIGLVIPEGWTEALGVTEHQYHLVSLYTGTIAGIAAVLGIALLIYRRRTNRAVFRATTINDKFIYVVLFGALVCGVAATLSQASGTGYDYRETIAPWFRSLFTLHPKTDLMADVPTIYQVHILIGLTMIAAIPYTRLVHIFSAPLTYLFRPYLVYRSRDQRKLGSRPDRPGWEKNR